MSGKIFKMEAHNSKSDHHLPKSVESKIPVASSSPISVRRQSSLRLKGERSRTYVRSISKDSKMNENITNRYVFKDNYNKYNENVDLSCTNATL